MLRWQRVYISKWTLTCETILPYERFDSCSDDYVSYSLYFELTENGKAYLDDVVSWQVLIIAVVIIAISLRNFGNVRQRICGNELLQRHINFRHQLTRSHHCLTLVVAAASRLGLAYKLYAIFLYCCDIKNSNVDILHCINDSEIDASNLCCCVVKITEKHYSWEVMPDWCSSAFVNGGGAIRQGWGTCPSSIY